MAAAPSNNAVVFKDFVPEGLPEMGKHWEMQVIDTPTAADLKDGQYLIKLVCLSVDPYMRGRMKDVKSYFPGFAIGQPGNGGAVGRIIESKNDSFKVGTHVVGLFPWQNYVVVDPSQPPTLGPVMALPEGTGVPLSTAIGVLGMPGMTAYFGFLRLCEPKEGETVVVSGAAGAVGSLVVQIAKIKGCYVVGIAGSQEKLDYLKEIGADAVINYKTTEDMASAIKDAAPKGVDCYFDNVGGIIADAVMDNINAFGRISCCGAISSYNLKEKPSGPRHEWAIITKQLRIQGFIVSRWAKEWPAGIAAMAQWIKEGKLKYRETKRQGLENTISAFSEMMSGKNIGKMVVELEA